MFTLGLNAAFHDSAACLVGDGHVIAAAEEERFTRIKHGKRPLPFTTWELPFHAVDYCLKHLDEVAFVAGTHNEESVTYLTDQMHQLGIANAHPYINFSQLYGMGANLSYSLARNGYNVSKYVPYGPVADAIPYLIRRAAENSSAAGHMSRELDMIQKELKRRKLA